jgi:hypothetical protein
LNYLAQVYEAEVLTLRVQHMAVVLNMVRDKTGDVDSAEAMFIRAQRLAGSMGAWHLAWGMFCAEVGFDPDAVLRAFGIEQQAIPASKAIEPAREQIDDVASMLRDLWNATMGGVAGNECRACQAIQTPQ